MRISIFASEAANQALEEHLTGKLLRNDFILPQAVCFFRDCRMGSFRSEAILIVSNKNLFPMRKNCATWILSSVTAKKESLCRSVVGSLTKIFNE